MAEVVATTRPSIMRLDIQGLRAVAVLMIVALHAGLPLVGGFAGVDVFFVISGFVITAMLMREKARSGQIAVRTFYVRRFRRLTPALALTVVAVLLASIPLQSPFGAQQTTAATGVGAMFLVANVVIAGTTGDYFSPAAATNPLLHTWSLSVEEQFYLVFPALLLFGWYLSRRRFGSHRQGALAVVIVIALLSFGLTLFASARALEWPATAVLGYYGALGRAWEFAAGALLALMGPEFARLPRRAGRALAWIGAALLVASALVLTDAVPYPGPWTLLPVAGTMAIIVAGTVGVTGVSRVLSLKPLVWIGDRSYSWYLWHWPLIVFALILWPARPVLAPLVAALASLGIAAVTFRFVEQPIRSGDRFPGQHGRTLALLCFGAPLVLAVGVWFGASRVWWVQWPTSYTYQDAASYGPGCHDTLPGRSQCIWPVADAAGSVLLLGDSQALSLSDAVIAADEKLGLSTEISSHSQCPFILPNRVSFSYDNPGCTKWQESALTYALQTRPTLVVIANRPYVNGMTGGVTLLDESGSVPADSAESAAAWRNALGGVVQELTDAGIRVLLAEAPPEADYDMPATGLAQLGRNRSTRAQAEEHRAVSFAADASVASAYPGVSLYDPVPVLCDSRVCPDAADGAFLYADPRHVSVAGSMKLEPSLQAAIASALSAG